MRFLAARAIPGLESVTGDAYRRELRLTGGGGRVTLEPGAGHVAATLSLDDTRDRDEALALCRAMLDLDADPVAIDAVLAGDPALAPLVGRRPGIRLPGAADGFELAVRAVVGQQVSVAAARTVLGRIVAALGPGFPAPAAVAAAPDDALPMPAARRRALRALGAAVAAGDVPLRQGGDPEAIRGALVALPGIGPWTAAYVTMRLHADRDAFLPTDLAARRGAARLGLPDDPAGLAAHAERWRPWRGYALMHLWSAAP